MGVVPVRVGLLAVRALAESARTGRTRTRIRDRDRDGEGCQRRDGQCQDCQFCVRMPSAVIMIDAGSGNGPRVSADMSGSVSGGV
jgi:hypothetical protein